MTLNIRFLGGADTVTGSKYCVEYDGKKLLVDCGLFQGYKQLRLRNWDPCPTPPKDIGAVILTHAHLDHSGYLPLLARNGFQGKVHSTSGTRDLCGILLPDSGHIQEEDAYFANKHGTPNTAQPYRFTPSKTPSIACNSFMLRNYVNGFNPCQAGRPNSAVRVTSWALPVCCWKWVVGAFCFQVILDGPMTAS
jgi:Cft2 family RNA processing exonuclease